MSSLQWESLYLGDLFDDKYDFQSIADLLTHFRENSNLGKRGIHTILIPFLYWVSTEFDLPEPNGKNHNLIDLFSYIIPPASLGGITKPAYDKYLKKAKTLITVPESWENDTTNIRAEFAEFVSSNTTNFDRLQILKAIIHLATMDYASSVSWKKYVYDKIIRDDQVQACIKDFNKSPAPYTSKIIAYNYLTVTEINKMLTDCKVMEKFKYHENFSDFTGHDFTYTRDMMDDLIDGRYFSYSEFARIDIVRSICRVLELYMYTSMYQFLEDKPNFIADENIEYKFRENIQPDALFNFAIIYGIFTSCVSFLEFNEALRKTKHSDAYSEFVICKNHFSEFIASFTEYYKGKQLEMAGEQAANIIKTIKGIFDTSSRLKIMNPLKGFEKNKFSESTVTEESCKLQFTKPIYEAILKSFTKAVANPMKFNDVIEPIIKWSNTDHIKDLIDHVIGLPLRDKPYSEDSLELTSEYWNKYSEISNPDNSVYRMLVIKKTGDYRGDTHMIGAMILGNQDLLENNKGSFRLANALTYSMILKLGLFKFQPNDLNAMELLLQYLQLFASAIYGQYFKEEKWAEMPSVLLVNLINMSNFFGYRNIMVPVNAWQKEDYINFQFIEPDVPYPNTYSYLGVQKLTDTIFNTIVTRVSSKHSFTDYAEKYQAFVRYIGDAIVNNTITSEYAIMALIANYQVVCVNKKGLFTSNGAIAHYKPFYDIMKYCLTHVDDGFFKLYDHAGLNAGDKDMNYSKLTNYLSFISFTTVLQNISMCKRLENEINGNYRKRYFKTLGNMRTGTEKSFGMWASEMPTFNDKENLYLLPFDDIENAIALFSSTCTNKSLHGNWYKEHEKEIISMAPLNPEEQHAPF